jgi:hypothetical protein
MYAYVLVNAVKFLRLASPTFHLSKDRCLFSETVRSWNINTMMLRRQQYAVVYTGIKIRIVCLR